MPFDQTGKPAILRPLGGIEKLFWLISQNRQTHFAITAEVAGSSQVAQWQEALDRIPRLREMSKKPLARRGRKDSSRRHDSRRLSDSGGTAGPDRVGSGRAG